MDMSNLERALSGAKANGLKQVCLLLVSGTTIYQAHDDIDEANKVLRRVGFSPEDVYIHVDAAYSGGYLWAIDDLTNGMRIDFEAQHLSSCSVSAQKALGSPTMGSVLLMKEEYLHGAYYEYIRSSDFTLSCCRLSRAATEIYYRLKYITGEGRLEWKSRWEDCIDAASDFALRLRQAGVDFVLNNPRSVTVVFPKPCEELVTRYFLVTANGRQEFNEPAFIAEVMFNFHTEGSSVVDRFFDEYMSWYKEHKFQSL